MSCADGHNEVAMRAHVLKFGQFFVLMTAMWVLFSLVFDGHVRVWFALGGGAAVTVAQAFGERRRVWWQRRRGSA
jgi:hypothetical protein